VPLRKGVASSAPTVTADTPAQHYNWGYCTGTAF